MKGIFNRGDCEKKGKISVLINKGSNILIC